MAEHLKYIASTLTNNGGLKVSLADALDSDVDSIGVRGRVVTGTLRDNATVTSNSSWIMTNVAGGKYMLVRWQVTAVTITSGTLNLLVEKALPNGTSWQTILNHAITTTEHKIAQFSATPDAASALLTQSSFPTADTVYNGPWDTVRVQLYGSGVFSVTLTIDYMVY